jgi:hypothetical protein
VKFIPLITKVFAVVRTNKKESSLAERSFMTPIKERWERFVNMPHNIYQEMVIVVPITRLETEIGFATIMVLRATVSDII